VYARSFTPLAASHALWQGMRRLRTRPLADMLYHDPQITRSRFFVCRLHRQHPLYRSMQLQLGPGCPPAQSVLARCSVFWRLNEPLLVAAAFLPAFWRIAGHSRPYRCPERPITAPASPVPGVLIRLPGHAYRASIPLSPVRMRTTCSTGITKILPSPILPV